MAPFFVNKGIGVIMQQEQATAKAADTIAEKEGPRTVMLKNGTEVQIIKCQVKNLGVVLGFVVHVFETINPEGKTDIDLLTIDQRVILQLVATSADRLFEVVAALSTMSKKELDELELDDALDIVMAVWEVNQTFFLQAVLPKVSGVLNA